VLGARRRLTGPGGAETETAEMHIRFDRAYACRVVPPRDIIYL
jgi:hypothetical protein